MQSYKRRVKFSTMLAIVLLLTLAAVAGVSAADEIWACTPDVNGSNDFGGQEDLTQMCTDVNPDNASNFGVRWSWDETWIGGGSAYFSCSMFDNDGNGNADYAICIQIMDDATLGTVKMTKSLKYECNDTRADRCANPVINNGTPVNYCSVSVAATDPFPGPTTPPPAQGALGGMGDDYPDDAEVFCTIPNSDVGGVDSVLINTCSFTSDSSPNSAPKDCTAPTGGAYAYVTIIKEATPDEEVAFGFTTTQTVGGTFSQTDTIYGSGASDRFVVPPGTYSISETSLPAGWELTASSCTNSGAPVGSPTSISISSYDDIVCTFENRAQVDLAVTKSDGDTWKLIGDQFDYTINVSYPTTIGTGATAYRVTVSDVLDPWLKYIGPVTITGGTGTCTPPVADYLDGGGGTLTCNLSDMIQGDTITVSFTVEVLPGVPLGSLVEIDDTPSPSVTCSILSNRTQANRPTSEGDVCNKVSVSTTSHDVNQGNNSDDEPKDIKSTTAVTLAAFTATGLEGGIQLDWETSNEVDNAGFNLYRAPSLNGKKTQLNAEMIPTLQAPGSLEGAVYSYVDKTLPGKSKSVYYYWLEDVGINGDTELHGPVSARPLPKLPKLLPQPGQPEQPVTE